MSEPCMGALLRVGVSCKLVTVSKVKRNCVRTTEQAYAISATS